jgi:YVTN family beta-propeller protein
MRSALIFLFLIIAVSASASWIGADGPQEEVFSSGMEDLYTEVPPIHVTGNVMGGDILRFYPKADVYSGLCDTDNDGILDTQINDFASFANASNNIFNEGIAACVLHAPGDRRIYDNPALWTDDAGGTALHLRPDLMPEYANGTGSPSTNATQFIQIEFPFDVDPSSVYSSQSPPSRDYLTKNIAVFDDMGNHVPCTVLVNGKDVFNNGQYSQSPYWPPGATVSPDVIILIAQVTTGQFGIQPNVALTGTAGNQGRWSGKEVYVAIGTLTSAAGKTHDLDSRSLVRRTGVDIADNQTSVKVIKGAPSEFIVNPSTGKKMEDHWPGVTAQDNNFVPTDVEFVVRFNKPVIPVSVGRSIVFNGAPFLGNMGPVVNIESMKWPHNAACVTPINPICSNLSLRVFFIDTSGVPCSIGTPLPFRVVPQSQNNLATYIIKPLIDIPGSSTDWSGDVAGEPPVPPTGSYRMRIEMRIHDYQKNLINGDPDGFYGHGSPENLGVAGFHGERFFMNGINFVSKTFSVLRGRRYVNAPVSPNVMYYVMKSGGIGAVDLDGTGMTTNAPGAGRSILVTSTNNYSPFGNSSHGDGNPYLYPVGLGLNTPFPGINEGSDQWWRDLNPAHHGLVNDSSGSNQLFPEHRNGVMSTNITDIEIGDFLDTLYYNRNSRYNVDSLHVDYVFNFPGNFPNNTIATPPTPNPPPLSIPVGMRPTGVVLDEHDILAEGAFTIMGREVFPPDLLHIPLMGPRQWVHLEHGGAVVPPQYPDKPFPPNTPGPGPWSQGSFVQNGPLAESCTFYSSHGYSGAYYGSRQQVGNFLFAADRFQNVVHVLNSNTMEEITTLSGVWSPDRLAITTDLKNLYVTNNVADSVSVFDVDPRSTGFLEKIAEIPVGDQPKGVCCQPEQEDVFVCNFKSNSISIISPSSNTVRKTLTRLLDNPVDISLSPRQQTFGWGTQTYFGYISNNGGDNVLVYESGPDGLGGIGYDDIIGEVPLVGSGGKVFEKIVKPRGLCYDPLYLDNVSSPLNLTGGVFVAHASAKGAAVTRINFVSQFGPWGPMSLPAGQPPSFRGREFFMVSQWTQKDGFLSGSGSAVDVALPDLNRYAWLNQNFSGNAYVTNYGALGNNPLYNFPINNKHPLRYVAGTPVPVRYPDLMFVSYPGTNTIDVIDIVNGTTTAIDVPLGPVKNLTSYFK